MSSSRSPVDPDPAQAPPQARVLPPRAWWQRAWSGLRSRFARQIAITTVALGALAAAGHFVGGMIGWWHAYEVTFGGPRADSEDPKRSTTAKTVSPFSIAVLPITDDGGSQENAWFVDNLTSDLTAELGTVSGAIVISRDSAMKYHAATIDPRQVAAELGVQHLVRGAARRDGTRVKLSLALIDGESGRQRWAQRFEFERSELARGLEDVVRRIARSVNLEMYRASGESSAALAPHEILADDVAMQGWGIYFRGLTRENVVEAARRFEEAVAQNPGSLRGWGGVAAGNFLGVQLGFMPDRAAAARRLQQASDQLQRLDENDWYAFMARMQIAQLRGDNDALLAITTEAAARFPSYPQVLSTRALALMGLGRFEECIDSAQKAVRLSPREYLTAIFHWTVAVCHFMLGQYPQAVEHGRTGQQLNPSLVLPTLTLAAALHREGKDDEARRVLSDFPARHPGIGSAVVTERLRGSDTRFVDGRQRIVDSLQKLGMR